MSVLTAYVHPNEPRAYIQQYCDINRTKNKNDNTIFMNTKRTPKRGIEPRSSA